MIHLPRLISKICSWFIPDDRLFRSSAPPFLPFYHTVSNQKPPHILNYPITDEKTFEKEIDFYLRHFTPVSLNELLSSKNSKKKIFHLSFDDGLKECAEIIAPVLLRKGIPATFFINSGFVDNKDLFHRYKASLILNELFIHPDSETEGFLKKHGIDRSNILQTGFSKRDILDEAAELLALDFSSFLEQNQPYMSTQEIVNLSQQGFTIGGHSHKHPEFHKISEKKQLKHIRKSMNWLELNIQPRIKAFAFPYTDHGVSSSLIKRLHEESICDITFGTAGVKHDMIRHHFQRYPAEQKGDFKRNLKTEFVYYKLRKITGKATVKH